MPPAAPLQVTVEIGLGSGSAAGERCFRLCHELSLPPRLSFAGSLPIDGVGEGSVRFLLPDGTGIECGARLEFDPAAPQAGSSAHLSGLDAEEIQRLQRYVEERNEP